MSKSPQVASVSKPSAIDPKNLQEFLVFQLGADNYAIDIMKIQEIRQYDRVMHINNAPKFIPGVMNIHDEIVPIIDMRILFKVAETITTALTLVIILNLASQRVIGIIVDGVSDVAKLDITQIKTTPEFISIIHNAYIQGIGMLSENALIVLDIEKLLSIEEINLLDKAITQNQGEDNDGKNK